MARGSEAFKEFRPGGEPEDKKEADVIPFKEANPLWSAHANFMAKEAGITLSPNAVIFYGLLRDEKPDPAKKYQESDQKTLAEALRRDGDMDSLAKFTEKYPHIFNPKP